jgi:hypothetical protein
MFKNDPRDMCQTLQEMHREAYQRSNCNHIEAVNLAAQYIKQDLRFKGYDPYALAERVRQCRSNGAQLDLDDPTLRGQEARPLDRGRW